MSKVIEPIKGSSSLFGKGNNRDFNRVQARVESWTSTVNQENFQAGQFNLGEYNYDRFPESYQNWRPEYSYAMGQFDIRHPDGTPWNQDDATKCLKEHPLSYPDDYHNQSDAGKPILRADIANPDDAYFNHRSWVRYGQEGRIELGDSKWEDMLFAAYSGSQGVRQDDGSQFRPGDVRSQIKNPEMDAKREERKVDEYFDAQEILEAMKDDKQRMEDMLTMLGVRITDGLSLSALRKQIIPYLQDVRTEGGVPRMQLFLQYGRMDKAELPKQALIRKACYRGLINESAGVYKFLDSIVGRSFAEAVAWFYESSHLDSLKHLKDQLDGSTSGVSA